MSSKRQNRSSIVLAKKQKKNKFKVNITYHNGNSFTIKLKKHATGLELKNEIQKIIGTHYLSHFIYKKQNKNDGSNENDEDDINPIQIKNNYIIKEGDEFCLYKINSDIFWIALHEDILNLQLNGLQLTQIKTEENRIALSASNKILRNGVHYLEVEIINFGLVKYHLDEIKYEKDGLSVEVCNSDLPNDKKFEEIIYEKEDLSLGVCKLNLYENHIKYDYRADLSSDTDIWFMRALEARLYGNGYSNASNKTVKSFKEGDKVGILLNLDNGSLIFIKDRKHGFGFPNGSITGPVKFGVELYGSNASIKIIENAEIPENISIEFIEPAVDNSSDGEFLYEFHPDSDSDQSDSDQSDDE